MSQLLTPYIAGLGTTELLIIVGVIVLLFGASKLPELARGSGRALRIFKAETKGLMDDDDAKTERQRELDSQEREAEFDRRHPANRSDEPGAPGSTS
ncbi:twin-arginine translocase TatA/TatE family subunit [Nocardioides marmoraquaticus]